MGSFTIEAIQAGDTVETVLKREYPDIDLDLFDVFLNAAIVPISPSCLVFVGDVLRLQWTDAFTYTVKTYLVGAPIAVGPDCVLEFRE